MENEKNKKPIWKEGFFSSKSKVVKPPEGLFTDEELARLSDEDMGIDPWEGTYDYGFNEPIVEGGKDWSGKDRKTPERNDKGWYTGDDYWSDYQKTGNWRGYSYYATPTLDYRYIEQMANMFAAHHEVSVNIGQNIGIDIDKKILTYNPTLLMFGTKANMIAALLHEIGHLKHSVSAKNIVSPYLDKYGDGAYEVINMFEDFRIDTIMAKSYEGAEDIFAANEPIIEELARKFQEVAKKLMPAMYKNARALAFNKLQNEQANKIEQYYNAANPNNPISPAQRLALKELYDRLTSNEEKVKQDSMVKSMMEYENKIKNHETLFHYLAAMTLTGYGKEPKNMPEGLQKRIDLTKGSAQSVKHMGTMKELVDELNKNVFPHIEDLLEEMKSGENDMKNLIGGSDAKTAMDLAIWEISGNRNTKEAEGLSDLLQGMDFDGKSRGSKNGMRSRMNSGSGHSENNIPKEWADGDYTSIKESVNTSIRELINKMTFIRRKEEVIKWEGNQRRGKLRVAALYKHKTGSRRLFKKMLPNTDTLSSFAFSIVIDISGSMSGERIIHTVRGVVILAEVFEKMGIPFEIKTFDDNFIDIKKFDDPYDDSMRKKIGGIVKRMGGGTNLYYLFGKNDKEILARSEKNKFVIILSDGGVGGQHNGSFSYHKSFTEWGKKNVKPFGVGINCGSEIVDLCLGNGFHTNEAQELPSLFSAMLKDMVNKRTTK